MIRIMHISSSLLTGGVERIVRNFAARLDTRRYQFSACARDHDGVFGEEIRAMDMPVFVLGKPPGITFRLWAQLYRMFRRQQIDVVHTHNLGPLFYGAIPARMAGVRVVVHTDHGTKLPEAQRRMWACRYLSSWVDSVTAVSPAVKRDLIQHVRLRSDQVIVIRNGIDLTLPTARKSPQDLRQELRISPDCHIVGVCCRLTEQKGVANLLRAAPAVLARHPHTVFLLVGDGDLREDLERLSENLNLRGHVTFAGFRDDVHDILDLFDIYVLPSLFEGIPLGLLEAMLHRKPVVATRVGSNADIVEDRVSGRLVSPGHVAELADAIVDIFSDPVKAARMGEAAYKTVTTEYSLDRMVDEYDALYMKLLGKRC